MIENTCRHNKIEIYILKTRKRVYFYSSKLNYTDVDESFGKRLSIEIPLSPCPYYCTLVWILIAQPMKEITLLNLTKAR